MQTILLAILWGVITAFLAKKKNLNIILWAAIGAGFGLMGALLCFAYSSFKNNKDKNNGLDKRMID